MNDLVTREEVLRRRKEIDISREMKREAERKDNFKRLCESISYAIRESPEQNEWSQTIPGSLELCNLPPKETLLCDLGEVFPWLCFSFVEEPGRLPLVMTYML